MKTVQVQSAERSRDAIQSRGMGRKGIEAIEAEATRQMEARASGNEEAILGAHTATRFRPGPSRGGTAEQMMGLADMPPRQTKPIDAPPDPPSSLSDGVSGSDAARAEAASARAEADGGRSLATIWELNEEDNRSASEDVSQAPRKGSRGKKADKNEPRGASGPSSRSEMSLPEFMSRIGQSFTFLNDHISALSARVDAIGESVSALESAAEKPDAGDSPSAALEKYLSGNRPVTLNVAGLSTTIPAVNVYSDGPSIAVVCHTGTVTVNPEAGAKMHMHADGENPIDEDVAYAGARFEIADLGIAILFFIAIKGDMEIKEEKGEKVDIKPNV